MWQRIKSFFKDSETIFFARLQMAVGIILEIVTTADPYLFAPIFGEYFPWFLLANGILTEYLRRRRDDTLARKPDEFHGEQV
ncbi:hypothetical protein [Mesorhizobium xinjiangense]|uniref:hypothetical protein n=1 Tax=Mesorhizobium xinjiangense TaxID=2678685 RepID=UPI0012EEA70F|nr:hypothetical protein [Mesorhizobium xinjiangense]